MRNEIDDLILQLKKLKVWENLIIQQGELSIQQLEAADRRKAEREVNPNIHAQPTVDQFEAGDWVESRIG
jgi:hypothetical protein